MEDNYDVIVIGAGPGGYVAAIRASQLGLKTACVDNRSDLGGTCLNVGCIPSKALLDSSEQYHLIKKDAKKHGIIVENCQVDVKLMQARKNKIVKTLTAGIKQLFAANGVTRIHGFGQVESRNKVVVLDENDIVIKEITSKSIIIATGSTPIELKNLTFDGDKIVDSSGALDFDSVPERLGVIGAGVIGLELGSVWSRLGSEVTILEAATDFLLSADDQIARDAFRLFKKQGLKIQLGSVAEKVEVEAKTVKVDYLQSEQKKHLEVDKLVVAVGRRPATEKCLGESSGVKRDDRGFIIVDDQCRTNVDGIWAIGDAVRGPMLAHKSSEEGIAVAERIAGGAGHVDLEVVPWVIYTDPEIAWVGKTEKELKQEGVDFVTGSFPFAATGRARAMESTEGFVKIIADSKSDRVLGVHILGPRASELIGECVVAMSYHASAEDLARIIHAHPTLSEAIHEAALAVDQRAIHKVNVPKK